MRMRDRVDATDAERRPGTLTPQKQSKFAMKGFASIGTVSLAIEASSLTRCWIRLNEVEALYELFTKISYCIIKDGLIHKEEFQLALFRNSNRKNLFADQIFDLFDLKRNGVIEFEEFVRSLHISPGYTYSRKDCIASPTDIKESLRPYVLRGTSSIEREELKEMVLAILNELDLLLSDEAVEQTIDQTTGRPEQRWEDRSW